jgi:hypothetical protein
MGCSPTATTLDESGDSFTRTSARLRTTMQHAVFKASGEDTGNRYLSTVAVSSPESPYTCSGILAHPSLVLTAAHCACTARDGRKQMGSTSCSKRASVKVYTYEEAQAGHTLRPEIREGRFVPHEKFKAIVNAQNAVLESTSDLAVIFLEEPIRNVPLGFELADRDPRIRDLLTVVGYGLSGPGTGGSAGRRLFGRNEVTGIALSNISDKDDGDVVFLFEKAGSQAAPGDSGGPCFLEAGSNRWLIGIVSQTRGDGLGSRFTSIYPHLPWLKAQIKRAAEQMKTRKL